MEKIDLYIKYPKLISDVIEMVQKGDKIYFEITKGDYAGSIAQVFEDPKHPLKIYDNSGRKIIHNWITLRAKWDGRKNNIKLPFGNSLWLRGYQGPTVFKRINSKADKIARIDAMKPEDFDGNRLYVGDEVIYINSRYGSGSRLDHGIIKEFSADRYDTFVIVQKLNEKEESRITNPSQYIYKRSV